MTSRGFAEKTKVPVNKTRTEIEATLNRYGAKSFAFFIDEARATIMFEANARRLRFDLPLPRGSAAKDEAETRRLWRALLLSIKAKLESVKSGIETFEEAFLAHIVLPDGITVGQHTSQPIALAYKGEPMPPLLPPPRKPNA